MVTCEKSPNFNFGQLNRTLTVFPPSVEILHIVIEADPDGGEAQLPLETCNQPIVQGPGALSPDHGADGSEHAPVADALHGLLLSLDLGSQAEVNGSTAIAGGKNTQSSRKHAAKNESVLIGRRGGKPVLFSGAQLHVTTSNPSDSCALELVYQM